MCHSFNDWSEGLAPPWELQRQLVSERRFESHHPSLVFGQFSLSACLLQLLKLSLQLVPQVDVNLRQAFGGLGV